MRYLFGIWTMVVALTVSAIAAYYSIIGLTAIFAAAFVPVIIMGASLEVAKITTAIWLHSFWNEGSVLTLAYLTCAVVVLMIITSMGIFGFLSKAHIEQSAGTATLTAQIQRIDQSIARENSIIDRANATIEDFSSRVSQADISIQARIEAQERLIRDTRARLDRDIATQNQIINRNSASDQTLSQELERLEERRSALIAAQAQNDVRALQAMVGATVDGVLGPNTRQKIVEYEQSLDNQRSELISRLEEVRSSERPEVRAAEQEITRLQEDANAEIAQAQAAINAFREQLVAVTTQDNTSAISAQNAEITNANLRIDELMVERFDLESKLRTIEVEVGPVKYIAEMVYGDTTPDILEKAVRGVIILLVLVFDPLAIVLVLAGISLLRDESVDTDPKMPHTETEQDMTPEHQDLDQPEPTTSNSDEPDPQHQSGRQSGSVLRVNKLTDDGHK